VNDRGVRRQLTSVRFGNGNQAVLSDAQVGDVADVIAELGLEPPANGRPVIVVCGGAANLTGGELERAGSIVENALASATEVTRAFVIDGGTAAGVMQLTGRARARWPDALAVLVGVAPAGRVSYPGTPTEDREPLEENHSHFILADSSEWGGETGLLIAATEQLAAGGPVVMLLAGGGRIATAEVLAAVRRHWPVFVVPGTGGLADSLLTLWTSYRIPRRRFAAWIRPDGHKFRPVPPLSAITDTELREMIGQGDIRPVTEADPQSCARRLAWELQDEPVVKDAWQRVATYDQLAVRLRRLFTRFQGSILVLGVAVTALALIDNRLQRPALHWAVIAVPVLISVLIALTGRRAVGQRWVMLRAAAESIKAEIYRYRTLETGLAAGHGRTADAGQQQLVERLDAIEKRLMQTEASSGPLTPYQGPLPPAMYGAAAADDGLSPLSPDRYLDIRVRDQLSYYHARVRRLNRWRNFLQLLAIASGAAGAILAAAKLEVWIGLTAGASAAALAYLSYLQVDNSIVTYNQAAARLTARQRGWQALRPARQDRAAVHLLVTSCESVLATELSGWVQQMNDTLEDIRRDQADAAGRIDHPADDARQRSGEDDSSPAPAAGSGSAADGAGTAGGRNGTNELPADGEPADGRRTVVG